MATRRTPRPAVSPILYHALGSNAEVEAQATIAADLGCLDQSTADKIIDRTDSLGRMINRLQQHLNATS